MDDPMLRSINTSLTEVLTLLRMQQRNGEWRTWFIQMTMAFVGGAMFGGAALGPVFEQLARHN